MKINVDNDRYVYITSIENIILDRLRAAVHWRSREDAERGFKLLAHHFEEIDKDYLTSNTESKSEQLELNKWILEVMNNKT